MLTLSHYQDACKRTRAYPEYGQSTIGAITYCALGLAGEAGETANKVKKTIRDGYTDELKQKILEEIGDTLWYAAMLADEFGASLETIAEDNLAKLNDRAARNKIQGDGDKR